MSKPTVAAVLELVTELTNRVVALETELAAIKANPPKAKKPTPEPKQLFDSFAEASEYAKSHKGSRMQRVGEQFGVFH